MPGPLNADQVHYWGKLAETRSSRHPNTGRVLSRSRTFLSAHEGAGCPAGWRCTGGGCRLRLQGRRTNDR